MNHARDKGASSWLTSLPLQEQEIALSKQDFRDSLRFNLPLESLPSSCTCGYAFSVNHALSCKKGGFVGGSNLQVAGRGLQVAGRGLQVAGCRLQVAGRRLQVAGRRLRMYGTFWLLYFSQVCNNVEAEPRLIPIDMSISLWGLLTQAPMHG